MEIPLPAIAHVVVNGGFLHYVVIHKIKKNKIYVADPVLSLLKEQKNLLVTLFFAAIFFNIFGLLGAFYFKFLINDIVTNQLLQTLHIVSVGIII